MAILFAFKFMLEKIPVCPSGDLGLCSRVVLELLDGLEEQCPKVYLDNYYTSPELFLALYNKKVNVCGTARSNRKY